MTLRDAAYHVGIETTFRDATTPTRSYEVDALAPAQDVVQLRRSGFRKAAQAQRQAKSIHQGSSHQIAMPVQKSGMGLLLQLLTSSLSGPTQVAATTAYTQDHAWGAAGVTKSFNAQQVIARPETGVDVFTMPGCMVTSYRIRQSSGGLLMLEADVVGDAAVTDTSEATPAYVADQGEFCWADLVLSLDSTPFNEIRDFEMAVDTGLKTDRRHLRGGAGRTKPVHTGYPTVSGRLDADWVKTEYYDDFVAGAVIPLNAKWSGTPDEIEAGHTFEFEIDLGSMVFVGDAPEQRPEGDTATQSLPFEVVEPASGPLFSIKTKSSDTAL